MKARRFRNAQGFMDKTDYIECRDDGTVSCVQKDGERKGAHCWTLELCLQYVKEGNFVELNVPPCDKHGNEFKVGQTVTHHNFGAGLSTGRIDSIKPFAIWVTCDDGKHSWAEFHNITIEKEATLKATDMNGKEFKVGQRIRHHGIGKREAKISEVSRFSITIEPTQGFNVTQLSMFRQIEIIEEPMTQPCKILAIDGKDYEVHDAAAGFPSNAAFALVEKKLPSGREVFSPEVQAALDTLDEALSKGDEHSKNLANALSMIRGPDTGNGYDKLRVTIPVRRVLFPKLAKASESKQNAFWNMDGGDKIRADEVSNDSTHFLAHARSAKAALNL